jgi:hypothetical protein
LKPEAQNEQRPGHFSFVIAANAGTQSKSLFRAEAAEIAEVPDRNLCFFANSARSNNHWVPAFAGLTNWE